MLMRRPLPRMPNTVKIHSRVSLWCWCAYKIIRNRSQPAVNSRHLFPEWVGNCRSHISRRVLDFSEVLIQLLNHQIIPLFSVQELETKLCSHCCATVGWHNIAVWFAQIFRFRFFVCNSSRFRTHWTKCNSSSFRFRYENSSAWLQQEADLAYDT